MIGKDPRQFHPLRRISYGRHRGKTYSEVPKDYLEWVAREGFGPQATRREWAQMELDRRKAVKA